MFANSPEIFANVRKFPGHIFWDIQIYHPLCELDLGKLKLFVDTDIEVEMSPGQVWEHCHHCSYTAAMLGSSGHGSF